MTEPEAGSDLRGMRTRAVRDGATSDWVITGTKHFICHADAADFVILFAATGPSGGGRRTPPGGAHRLPRRRRHAGARRAARLPQRLAPRLRQRRARVRRLPGAGAAVLGEVGRGFDVANAWLGTTRLQVAASCLGRARRALDLAVRARGHPSPVRRTIGRNQGVAFKLADMGTALESATWLTWRAAWLVDAAGSAARRGLDPAIAMAKLAATEMLAMVADEALQIHGGMGLMDELVLERIWRDARVERIWDGTSEIQRHIVSRSMLRAHGG